MHHDIKLVKLNFELVSNLLSNEHPKAIFYHFLPRVYNNVEQAPAAYSRPRDRACACIARAKWPWSMLHEPTNEQNPSCFAHYFVASFLQRAKIGKQKSALAH